MEQRHDPTAKPASASDTGASATEYAVVVSLIAVVIFAAVALLGGQVRSLFDRGASCTSAPSATC